MHIAKCCKCKRLFYMPMDTLYTEAICSQCESLFALGHGECDVNDVVAVVEANAGHIDGGRVAQMYMDWYAGYEDDEDYL